MYISISAMDKLLKQGNKRVAEDARSAMVTHIERHAEKIALLAAQFARHAGRRTILEEDISLAIEHCRV